MSGFRPREGLLCPKGLVWGVFMGARAGREKRWESGSFGRAWGVNLGFRTAYFDTLAYVFGQLDFKPRV